MIEELPEDDPRVALVQKALEGLSEHFDSVRIFATVHNPEGEDDSKTDAITRSKGNWYANYGFISEWIERQRERFRCDEKES